MKHDPEFMKVVAYGVEVLLNRTWFDVEKKCVTESAAQRSETAAEALKMAIGLGGGNSMHGWGDYWFIDYSPGVKISFLKGSDPIETVVVPRSLFMELAEKRFEEIKGTNKQLALF